MIRMGLWKEGIESINQSNHIYLNRVHSVPSVSRAFLLLLSFPSLLCDAPKQGGI